MTQTKERQTVEVTVALVPDDEIRLGQFAALSFKRTPTRTVEMYINNVLCNVLEPDEWEWFWEGLGRL